MRERVGGREAVSEEGVKKDERADAILDMDASALDPEGVAMDGTSVASSDILESLYKDPQPGTKQQF